MYLVQFNYSDRRAVLKFVHPAKIRFTRLKLGPGWRHGLPLKPVAIALNEADGFLARAASSPGDEAVAAPRGENRVTSRLKPRAVERFIRGVSRRAACHADDGWQGGRQIFRWLWIKNSRRGRDRAVPVIRRNFKEERPRKLEIGYLLIKPYPIFAFGRFAPRRSMEQWHRSRLYRDEV